MIITICTTFKSIKILLSKPPINKKSYFQFTSLKNSRTNNICKIFFFSILIDRLRAYKDRGAPLKLCLTYAIALIFCKFRRDGNIPET